MGLFHFLHKPFSIIAYLFSTTSAKEDQFDTDKSIGARGETIAANYLKRQGMRILHRGYRSPLGEVDIIAIDRRSKNKLKPGVKELVFVEVKTWSRPSPGEGPADAVNAKKQIRLTRLAIEYLKLHRVLESPARFDVVEVVLEPLSIRHFKNAFEATGEYQMFT